MAIDGNCGGGEVYLKLQDIIMISWLVPEEGALGKDVVVE